MTTQAALFEILASATRISRLASGDHAEQCGGSPIPGREGFFATPDRYGRSAA